MQILKEIVEWANNKLAPWQSDALRRIWRKGELDEKDKDEFLLMIKREHGLVDEKSMIPDPIRISLSDIGSQSSGESPAILKSISDVEYVNALAKNQKINFGLQGITVIYGENASGKSGYARVLKRACMARGESERIWPDISMDSDKIRTAQAIFIFDRGEKKNIPFKWRDDMTDQSPISDIAVFDSKCARVIVDERNEVIFMPYGLDTLAQLANLCDELKNKLQEEMNSLTREPDVLRDLVGDGKLLDDITGKTDKERLRKLGDFNQKKEENLDKLELERASIKQRDPQIEIKKIRNRINQIYRLRCDLYENKRLFSYKSFGKITSLRKKMLSSNAAAELASRSNFENEPLAGVGSDTWRTMFLAAKKYSEEGAYSDKEFPFIGEESRCVLCQQLLDSDAKKRLSRFSEFLQKDLEKTAQAGRDVYKEYYDKIVDHDYDITSKYSILIEELNEINTALKQELLDHVSILSKAKDAIISFNDTGEMNLEHFPSGKAACLLSKYSKELERKIVKLESSDITKDLEEIEKNIGYLKNVRLLNENLEKIFDYIDNQKTITKLTGCISALNTRKITDKSSEIMGHAINVELQNALNHELSVLGAEHLRLEIIKTGRKARDYTKLRLRNSKLDGVSIEDVLSEGEHRVVAIASFLAELSLSATNNSIIFDDPVRSLDHNWREKFASRLVRESHNRQVIVFTHDIAFLLAINYNASLSGVKFHLQAIERSGKGTGVCSKESPWIILKVDRRINILRENIQTINTIKESGNKSQYNSEVSVFYSRLRSTWEKMVEELLFHKVIFRLRKSVNTQELRYVEVTDDDYKTIFAAMSKCSDIIEAHDTPEEVGETIPAPAELESDLQQLQEFCKLIRRRGKEVSFRRKLPIIK